MVDEKTREETVEDMLQQEVYEAWQWLLGEPKGLLILWSVLDKCGLFSYPFYGNSHDALHKGRQQVGNEVLVEHVFPMGMKFYTDMLLAAEERQKKLEAAIDETDEANEEKTND